MVENKTRWVTEGWSGENEEAARRLSSVFTLPPLVARLLVQRGLREEADVSLFLYGTKDHLHDPFLLRGMEEAARRIQTAGQRGERIRIYGDYDADGVSSTSLLIRLFQSLNYRFDYYIPHRSLEGYGLNRKAIALAAEEGVTLIVTVDTGISAYEEIEFAKELGIDVVVTDHHEPPDRIPDACAVVNPKRSDCSYPFKGLAGAGVAFKLATALLGRPPLEWADIVCLGTIADLMPLTDENRILVKYGLERLRREPGIGFRALAEAGGMELASITSTGVAFGMAPRINAAGRLDHAKRAVELLTSDDYDFAIVAAAGLDSLNKDRQRIVDQTARQAEAQWEDKVKAAERAGQEPPSVIVLAGEGWNVGVIGIVASKLLERHYKPVVILGIDGETGMCKGSARSIDGFDLHAALTSCSHLLDHYGGHQAAAGMSLHRDNLPEFEKAMSGLAAQWLQPDDWIPKTVIDMECAIEEATLDTISQLELLEPFGMGNPSPRLLIKGAGIAELRALGKESKHLKLSLRGKGHTLDAIAFGMGELAGRIRPGQPLDIVGELSVNEWNGRRRPQLQLHDLHQEAAAVVPFPTREQFVQVYQRLRRSGATELRGAAERLAKDCGLTADAVQLMLDVFEELQFINIDNGTITPDPAPAKRDLSSSLCYRKAEERSTGRRAAAAP